MKIAIIGTGGVGGYFGARLAEAGNDVTFLARGKHFNAIQSEGLKITSALGDIHIHPAKVVDDIRKIEKVDLVILGVKSWQVKEVAQDLPSLMHENTLILPLQNGILAGEELMEVLGEKPVLGGLCKIFSKIEDDGVINHFGGEPLIVFGEFNGEITSRAEQVRELINNAKIGCKLSDDIEAELWKKFISICTSALLAVTNTSYGELRSEPETRQLLIELLKEIFAVSRQLEINLPADIVSKTLAAIDDFPYEATSSLTRDVWAGKPSEIEYQNGTLVRLGQKLGIPTPVNRFVYYSILPVERKARKENQTSKP